MSSCASEHCSSMKLWRRKTGAETVFAPTHTLLLKPWFSLPNDMVKGNILEVAAWAAVADCENGKGNPRIELFLCWSWWRSCYRCTAMPLVLRAAKKLEQLFSLFVPWSWSWRVHNAFCTPSLSLLHCHPMQDIHVMFSAVPQNRFFTAPGNTDWWFVLCVCHLGILVSSCSLTHLLGCLCFQSSLLYSIVLSFDYQVPVLRLHALWVFGNIKCITFVMIKVIGKSKKACFKGENEIKKHCVMNSEMVYSWEDDSSWC